MKAAFAKKKWFVAALSLVLSLLMTVSALAAEFGVVTGTNSLNLRSAGSSSSQWLGSYSGGTWVEILMPMTWNDLKRGSRSYAELGQNPPERTVHFFLRME